MLLLFENRRLDKHSGGLLQLRIQRSQLLQEAAVREDPAVLFDLEDGLQEAVMLVDHQVGQDDGGRPAHAHCAVDENPSCSKEKVKKNTQGEQKEVILKWSEPERSLYHQLCRAPS